MEASGLTDASLRPPTPLPERDSGWGSVSTLVPVLPQEEQALGDEGSEFGQSIREASIALDG